MPVFDLNLNQDRLVLDIYLPPADLQACASATRVFTYTGSRPADWQLQFYKIFLEHPTTIRLAKEVLNVLRREVADEGDFPFWVIQWVQEGIKYDHAKAAGSMQEGVQYPVETVSKGRGVCSDKSLLLASVLLEMGYGVCLFCFERANHMAVGVQAPLGCGAFGSDFAFVETTQLQTVGVVPDKMAGGRKLDGRPEVWVLKRGKTFHEISGVLDKIKEGVLQFGKDFAQMNDTQRDLRVQMQSVQKQMDLLKPKLNGCRGALPPDLFRECHALNAEYNALVSEYNALVNRFNESNR